MDTITDLATPDRQRWIATEQPTKERRENMKHVEVQFNNVTITISAKDPKTAYSKLCKALDTLSPYVEWTTDTYEVYNETTQEQPTTQLFPVLK
jgi:hypothetical protein